MSDLLDDPPAPGLGWPPVLVTTAVVVFVFSIVTVVAGKFAVIYMDLGLRDFPPLTRVFLQPAGHGAGAALLIVATLGSRRMPRLGWLVGIGTFVYLVLAAVAMFRPLMIPLDGLSSTVP